MKNSQAKYLDAGLLDVQVKGVKLRDENKRIMSGISPQNGIVDYECPACPKTFTSKRRMEGHFKNRHKDSSSSFMCDADKPKEDCYSVLPNKKEYMCNICKRKLSSKQRVLQHLHKVHYKSPMAKTYRMWKDPNFHKGIPKTTKWRSRKSLEFRCDAESQANDDDSEDGLLDSLGIQNDGGKLYKNIEENEDVLVQQSGACCDPFASESRQLQVDDPCESVKCDNDSNGYISESTSCLSEIEDQSFNNSYDNDYITSELSEADYDSFSDDDSEKSSMCSDGESTGSESDQVENMAPSEKSLSEAEALGYCKYAYTVRYNTSGCASNDLETLVKIASMDQYCGIEKTSASMQVIHYCTICNSLFPEDKTIVMCITEGCDGLRYQGGRNNQQRLQQIPRGSFVIADVAQQVKQLLEISGNWEKITRTKTRIKEKVSEDIRDITDGEAYRQFCQEGSFLADSYHLSTIFNTDGIPLYKSSKTKLWPIFLAINELPVEDRFKRDNILVAGIWQGKGNPPFKQYLEAFCDHMNELFFNGLKVKLPGVGLKTVKVCVLLGTLDLQAKAYVTSMTMHNGQYGCSTCEEPGVTVRQGRGYSRKYPYRIDKPASRFSDDIKENKAPIASTRNRQVGICGKSGMTRMQLFDLVDGFPPDYMHGVLLGVTKTLMYRWFSATHSKENYFIGHHLTEISAKLQNICPPDYIERLPKNLEQNYGNFKATELQTWLLFYAIPCLDGILREEYMDHFCLLSESIYILLSDSISQTDINHASTMLDEFYQKFSLLYPDGCCGLNVHNIGVHLVDFVKKWGPLFCWSCFPFEDANAVILDSVHGTGDITAQYVNLKILQGKLSQLSLDSFPEPHRKFVARMTKKSRQWSGKLKKMHSCMVAGKLINPTPQEADELVLVEAGATAVNEVKKVLRVEVKDQKFYSKQYGRMLKRICHVGLTDDGKVIEIDYFIVNTVSGSVFAVGSQIQPAVNPFIYQCHHILKLSSMRNRCIVDVEKLCEKVFFIKVDNCVYISRMPNLHGHCVFK